MKDRMSTIAQQRKNIEHALKNQENNVRNLEQKLTLLAEKKPVDKRQLDTTTYKLQEAKKKLEDMKDEKEKLERKENALGGAQKKIEDELKARSAEEGPAEGKDTTMEFLRTWAELNGDRTIPEPLPGRTTLMGLLPDSSSAVAGGGGAWMR